MVMNNRPLLLVLVTVSLLVPANSSLGQAQTPAPAPLAPGQTLTYDLSWSIFPAGEMVDTFLSDDPNGRAADHIKTTTQSKGVFSLLYNVQDEFYSHFDPQTLCSHRISKKISEGRRRKETELVFDPARRLAILDEHDLAKPGSPLKHAENEIPGCVEDIVTGFFYLRRQPLEIGKEVRVAVNDGSKTHMVSVEVQARERIQTPLGERQAFRLEPKVFDDVLYKRKGRMLIWMSDDSERLPLRIKAMILLGTITGDLRAVTKPAPTSPTSPP
jgi:hypothetical protein